MGDSKQLSKERYTRFAQGYVTSLTHAKGADLDMLIDFTNPQPDWQALDVATGGGHTALKFASYVKHVTASDLTPNMLDKARDFITEQNVKNVSFKIADAEDLPFEDKQFDLVTCRIAPHHFPDIGTFVKEAARVLKTNGLLIVQDHVLSEDEEVAAFADNFEKVRDPSHNYALSRSTWIQIFEDVGLQVEKTHELTKHHQFIDWAKRQGNDDETIAMLREMLSKAPQSITDWMQPQAWDNDAAAFVNHHLIIMGRKSDSKY